jgi:hypothetical protein
VAGCPSRVGTEELEVLPSGEEAGGEEVVAGRGDGERDGEREASPTGRVPPNLNAPWPSTVRCEADGGAG